MLEMPSLNYIDKRRQIAISSDGVKNCRCGAMPTGVEYVSETSGVDGKPEHIGACVIIECANCGHIIMTETVATAIALWSVAQEKALAPELASCDNR